MKAATTIAPKSAHAEKQLKTFIDKFEPKQQKLIRAIRKALPRTKR